MGFLSRNASPELAHQIGIVLYISVRERYFRWLMVSFLCAAMLIFLPGPLSTIAALALLASEAATLAVATPFLNTRPKPNVGFAALILVLEFVAACCYVMPSLLFISNPDFPIRFMGMIWLLGASYTAHIYASAFYFYWAIFIPSVVCGVLSVTILYANAPENYLMIEWVAMAMFITLYFVNAVMMLFRQRDTLKALTDARSEAHARLVELEFLSQSDALTSLANRTAFDERLKSILSSETKPKHDLAVALIDLDQFKPVNDSFGHEAGDCLLIETASRLEEFVKGRGFAARLGGDEFALILRKVKSRKDAESIGDELADILSEPMDYNGEVIPVSGSIGIARVADVGEEINTLCKSADQAMFQAKRQSGISSLVYDDQTAQQPASLREKAVLEAALIGGQIMPYYQPQLDMLTGRIHGLEALARWETPTEGLVMPGAFLPKIEELGMMNNFTFSMLRQVLRDIENWQAVGIELTAVSVNLDEKSLATQTGIQDLVWLISEHSEAAKVLTLEVTEDVVLARSGEFIRRSIDTLVEMGVRISLDDFGTGFASFRHLQELTLHELKIDTSFVTTIGTDPVSKVIIEGFLAIAAGLNISVVAEGVETKAQQDFLLERGCYIGQGFLYSKAVSPKLITRKLIENSRIQLRSA